MSGLLVKSTLIMRENLIEMNERGLERIPVLLGGAALTRNYVEHDLRTIYNGRVFYGKDAFEGLRTIETLMEGKRTGELDPDFGTVPVDRTVTTRRTDAAGDRSRRRRAGSLRGRRRQPGLRTTVRRFTRRRRASRSTTSPPT